MFSSNFIISPFQGQDENIHLEKWNKIKGQSQQLSKRLLCFPPESKRIATPQKSDNAARLCSSQHARRFALLSQKWRFLQSLETSFKSFAKSNFCKVLLFLPSALASRRPASRGFLPLLDNIETIRMKKMQKKCAVFPLVKPKNKGKALLAP